MIDPPSLFIVLWSSTLFLLGIPFKIIRYFVETESALDVDKDVGIGKDLVGDVVLGVKRLDVVHFGDLFQRFRIVEGVDE